MFINTHSDVQLAGSQAKVELYKNNALIKTFIASASGTGDTGMYLKLTMVSYRGSMQFLKIEWINSPRGYSPFLLKALFSNLLLL